MTELGRRKRASSLDVKLSCTLGACDSASRSLAWTPHVLGPLFSDFGVSKAGSAVITRISDMAAAGREVRPPSVHPFGRQLIPDLLLLLLRVFEASCCNGALTDSHSAFSGKSVADKYANMHKDNLP